VLLSIQNDISTMSWQPQVQGLQQIMGLFHEFANAGSNNELLGQVQEVSG
jgi:hypothetical protein